MHLKNFEEVLKQVKYNSETKTVALACADDKHSLEAVAEVVKSGLIKPLLVGNKDRIKEVAESIGFAISDEEIEEANNVEDAASKAVKAVRDGRADFLMKGGLETGQLLKAVVNKETGLSDGAVMSHIAINDIPSYHKLLLTTDGGMLTYPTLEQKKGIVENAVSVLNKLGYDRPKVCVMAATEKVNPKMPETLDADALKQMNIEGEIKNCVVEGPISLDLALVKERAEVKKYESVCAGDADILLVPNIHAGNLLGKSLVEMAGAKMAGLIVGAKCPIVLTSRGSSEEEKFNSLMLACLASGKDF